MTVGRDFPPSLRTLPLSLPALPLASPPVLPVLSLSPLSSPPSPPLSLLFPCPYPVHIKSSQGAWARGSAVSFPSGSGRSPTAKVKRFGCIFRLKSAHLLQFHNDTFVIFTVPFGSVQRRHNKIPVGRLGASAPQLFGRGAIVPMESAPMTHMYPFPQNFESPAKIPRPALALLGQQLPITRAQSLHYINCITFVPSPARSIYFCLNLYYHSI